MNYTQRLREADEVELHDIAQDIIYGTDLTFETHTEASVGSTTVNDLYIRVSFPWRARRNGWSHATIGVGSIEYVGDDDYFIVEDIDVQIDPFEHMMPDIDQIMREATQERRAREAEYRRMVL